MDNKDILRNIFEGNLDIAIIIFNQEVKFIFDNKENFVIDINPFYERYFKKGIINLDQYKYAINHYRNGASNLTKDNLYLYFSSLKIEPKEVNWMRDFFMFGYNQQYLNNIYVNKKSYSEDIECLKMRLPRFLLDFNDKTFIHSYSDRIFEEDLPVGWAGYYSDSFLLSINQKDSYWILNENNFAEL